MSRPTPKVIVDVLDTQATAGETNTFAFDRLGHEYAVIDLAMIGIETTDPPTVMHLTSSNDNTTFGTCSGFTGGTDFTIPTAIRTVGNHSQGPTIVQFRADLRNAKRYIKITCNAATKMVQVTNIHLYKSKESPESATNAGVTALVVG